jgi:hypothetical protein
MTWRNLLKSTARWRALSLDDHSARQIEREEQVDGAVTGPSRANAGPVYQAQGEHRLGAVEGLNLWVGSNQDAVPSLVRFPGPLPNRTRTFSRNWLSTGSRRCGYATVLSVLVDHAEAMVSPPKRQRLTATPPGLNNLTSSSVGHHPGRHHRAELLPCSFGTFAARSHLTRRGNPGLAVADDEDTLEAVR